LAKVTPDPVVNDYLLEVIEEIKSSNKASIDKKVAISTAKDLLVVQQLEVALAKVFHKGWSSPPKYTGKRLHSPHKRMVNSLLSDLHFGAKLSSTECPLEYDVIQESRRLGKVAVELAEYKTQYRQETKLIIHLLGDIIQGMLKHDPRDGEPLAQQFAAALHYLLQFVLFQCSQYPSVDVYCTPGNHGRNIARHPERAIHQKWDSIETMIYLALRTAVLNAGIANCRFFIPQTPYYICPIFDYKIFGTHGDTLINLGTPNKTINLGSLATQIAKWNTARNIGGPFRVFLCGHLHIGNTTELPGKVKAIINGALVPVDSYGLSIGSPDITCGQWIIESVEKYPVGDRRFVEVDEAEKESKYNDIVTPFGW
jgi:hypothetical protein